LGLYHGLGRNLPTTYIGTYDWPGEKFRHHRLSETLEEINIPLSDEHFSKCKEWQDKVDGKTIIDTSFHQLAYLSPEFSNWAKKEVLKADIVIFSHPWIYPIVKESISKHQLIVYDAHNVEGILRADLLDDGGFGSEIVKEAVKVEYELCHIADLILACSHEDRELFNRFYCVPFRKIRVVPNGVFSKQIKPADEETKKKIKKNLGLNSKMLVIFVGSSYQPNIEAANFILNSLAPEFPEITFAICGSVGEEITPKLLKKGNISNVVVTGFLSEEQKLQYLIAADLAINPMFSGSGTNIKMFDYMAAGLPIISTSIGARGIEEGVNSAFVISNKKNFASEIQRIIKEYELRKNLSNAARSLVEDKYAWERISSNLGILLHRWCNNKGSKKPFFSVVIPTFERHDHLLKLMKFLSAQSWKDFEVIIVDQSEKQWSSKDKNYCLDHLYIHTNVIGAVKARNLGAFFARGEIIAFTDDDCEPMADWLKNARRYFNKFDIIGLEGLIKSDRYDDTDYRSVTNEGFEGLGFMSANLFIRSDVFNAISGFDERFDNPHFREDTDLAWRALQHGKIPFAHDVVVYHPPHKRDNIRESISERARFFEKDALLLKKHPEKYMELFLNERNWEQIPEFWENFLKGAKKYGVKIPKFYISYMTKSQNYKGAEINYK